MIDRAHELPVVRQAALLQVSRSSVYCLPRPVPPARLAIMHRIDALHLLASILTMIALYSVNLRIMGRPNIALITAPTAPAATPAPAASAGTARRRSSPLCGD